MFGRPAIAFFTDICMLPGLHVALHTLLTRWNEAEELPYIYIFYEQLSRADLSKIETTCKGVRSGVKLSCRPFSGNSVKTGRSLHGSLMAYGRLYLEQLVPEIDRVIYLDCDVVIQTDLSKMWNHDLKGAPIGAVTRGTFRTALDCGVCESFGISLDAAYFNSGVLLLDLAQWRAMGLTAQMIDFAVKNSAIVRSHDQSALNFVSRDNFSRIPIKYNTGFEPDAPGATLSEDGIVHFLGSPKPFDPGGRILSNQHALFSFWYEKAAGHPSLLRHYLRPQVLRRAVRIARSALRQARRVAFQ